MRPPRRGRDRVERRAALAEQHATGVGERHAPAVALEELNAEPLLQLADRPRERRLRDPEPRRGASEVQLLGDGDEVPQLAGFEIVHRTEA